MKAATGGAEPASSDGGLPASFEARLRELRDELAAFEGEVEASKKRLEAPAPQKPQPGVPGTAPAAPPPETLHAGRGSRVNDLIRRRLDYSVPDFSANLQRLAEAEEARQASKARLQAVLDGIEGELRNPILSEVEAPLPASEPRGEGPLSSSELEARARILLGEEEEIDDVQRRIARELQAVEAQREEEERVVGGRALPQEN